MIGVCFCTDVQSNKRTRGRPEKLRSSTAIKKIPPRGGKQKYVGNDRFYMVSRYGRGGKQKCFRNDRFYKGFCLPPRTGRGAYQKHKVL